MTWHGRFSDGQTSSTRPVTVTPTGMGLEILDEDRRPLGVWSLSGLVQKYISANNKRIDFGHRDHGDARLMLEGDGIVSALSKIAPHACTAPSVVPYFKIAGAFSAVVVVILVSVYLGSGMIASHIPLSWERKFGDMLINSDMISLFGGFTVCSSPEGDQALQKMTERITDTYDRLHDYDIKVVNSEIPNAFALPGGYIRIFKGLFDLAEQPETVAGVLAHEIGHVEERHAIQSLSRAFLVAVVIETLTGGTGLSTVLIDLSTLSFSRDMEREADRFASRRLLDTKQNPADLARFFANIEEKYGTSLGLLEGFYSTHPANPERVAALNEAAAGVEETEPVLTPEEWQALKTMCD